jgi:hypothetical protein
MQVKWHWRTMALGAAAALALAGCGGDDDDDGANAEAAAFCEAGHNTDVAFSALESGEGSPEDATAALDALEEAGIPEDISEEVGRFIADGRTALAEAEEGGEEEEGPPDIPTEQEWDDYATVGDWIADNCGYEEIDATAKDFEFEDVPDELEPGVALVRLTNEGDEFHEIAVFKIKDGEDRSIEDLLALPEEEAQELATAVGSTFAAPDKQGYTTIDLEPGRYGIVCFVPTGATPAALESGELDEEAPPHFTKGMHGEFEVKA